MIDLFTLRRCIGSRELTKFETSKDIAKIMGVDCDDIYLVKDYIYPLLYVNKDNGCVVPICGDPGFYSEMIKFKNNIFDGHIKNNDFEQIISLNDGQYALMVYDILENMIPLNQRYKCFMLAYKRADYNFGKAAINIDYYDLLSMNSLSDEQIAKLDVDENNEIVIYRAQGEKSTDIDCAISWTTSFKVAKWFAKRCTSSYKIYKAKVNIDHVTDYLDNENEIIVNYNYLTDVEIIGGN